MDKQQREYIHHLMLQYSDAMVRLTYSLNPVLTRNGAMLESVFP